MPCNKISEITEVNTAECHEIIDNLEFLMKRYHGEDFVFKKDHRQSLVDAMKENPDNLWDIKDGKVMYAAFEDLLEFLMMGAVVEDCEEPTIGEVVLVPFDEFSL